MPPRRGPKHRLSPSKTIIIITSLTDLCELCSPVVDMGVVTKVLMETVSEQVFGPDMVGSKIFLRRRNIFDPDSAGAKTFSVRHGHFGQYGQSVRSMI